MKHPGAPAPIPHETLCTPEEWAQAQQEDARFAINLRVWLSWGLLVGGVSLVYFAVPLGIDSVATSNGSGTFWNPDKAREAALTLRFLGTMFFVAGLLERVLLVLRPATSNDFSPSSNL